MFTVKIKHYFSLCLRLKTMGGGVISPDKLDGKKRQHTYERLTNILFVKNCFFFVDSYENI